MDTRQIRNFCIIAHINHGKSTLADRLLELTHSVAPGKMKAQFLDSNPIERERGITIKLAPARLCYRLGKEEFFFNLIDTPGHVDFSYEVSRSLAACEGAVLIVDAVSGVQAQTLANFSLAKAQGLKIIPVINKIDLEIARPEEVAAEIETVLGLPREEIIFISAKTGQGCDQVLEAIARRLPPPPPALEKPFRALVFNSAYDAYKGVIIWLRVMEGCLDQKNLAGGVRLLASGAVSKVLEMGIFHPEMKPVSGLAAGEVGYLATGLKDISLFQVGDTVASAGDLEAVPLPGYRPAKAMVFAGLYPVDNDDLNLLSTALGKLKLSDAALSFTPEISQGLGKGFRGGFLGLLHAEIVQERLEREFGVELVITPPTVEYRLKKTDGEELRIFKVSDFPDASQVEEVSEPMVQLVVFTPLAYLGPVISLCKDHRAELVDQAYFGHQVKLIFKMPLAEMVIDFYDHLKNVSSGFASLDWEPIGFIPFLASRLDLLLNGQKVDALSRIVPRDRAAFEGRLLVEKLAKLIPRQQFEVVIQAAVGGKILARSEIKPFRKDVTEKLYGGDQTRKDKLLQKQKKGKKKMKQVGRIDLPQEVFLKVFKSD